MGIQLNYLYKLRGELTMDFRFIIKIFVLKFSNHRLYQNEAKEERIVFPHLDLYKQDE